MLWADTADACTKPGYDQIGCPVPGRPVVHVFDTARLKLLNSIPLDEGEWGGPNTFTPDGSRLVGGGPGIRVYNARTLQLEEVLPSSFAPASGTVAFDEGHVYFPSGRRIYAAPLDHGASDPPPAGLVGFWPGDGAAADVAGNRPVRCQPGTGYEPGRVGQAFRFHGAGSWCETTNPWLNGAFVPGSLRFWLRSRVADGRIASQLSEDGREGWTLSIESSKLVLRLHRGTEARVGSRRNIAPWIWHFVQVTRDGPTVRLRVDSDEVSATLPIVDAARPVPALRLGGFDGNLDEVTLHDRPLN
ncbi:MAG: LamG domain-containing protein [Acidobacteria bacterium]|nr:LamG domain-containing protein [Acidobacteriota bacterium]